MGLLALAKNQNPTALPRRGELSDQSYKAKLENLKWTPYTGQSNDGSV